MNTKPLRVAFGIIGLMVVIGGIYFVSQNYKNLNTILPINNKSDKDIDANGPVVEQKADGTLEYNDNFYEQVKEKDIKELSKQSPELKDTYGIQETDAREKFVKEVLNDREPTNHMVIYNGQILSTLGVSILQGDYVTIQNDSGSEIQIKRVDVEAGLADSNNMPSETSSSNAMPAEFSIPSGTGFTANFDFLGEYKLLVDNKQFSVQVVAKYE